MAYDRLGGKKTLSVGGFLEEFQKDEVKRRVDIVGLFSSFGVELAKKGKSYVGLCPWHEDKTPSLSVDREKGLYNCFGCGESGDVFSLVQKMKGLGFPEALEYLKNFPTGGGAGGVSSHLKGQEKKKPASPEGTFADLNLDTVSSYYRKRLPGSDNALAYLAKRGLESPELLKRFSVGFADGTLLSKVSNGQKERLKELGIIQEKGGEHLFRCIVVPLHDDTGRTVGLYGRKIEENGSVKHLYLKGPHRGVFNRKAGRVYDEIVLTESILDALSLVELGIENVQALYGINGLTEEHLALLKGDRVKTVALALDADQAGRKASAELKERLLKEGFSVKIVHPHQGKDWNELLVAGCGVEEVRGLIDEAPLIQPEGLPALNVKRKGPQYLFTTGGIRYRLLGVNPVFVSSLRVNIRAEYNEQRYIDNVDLYSARSRTAFSLSFSHKLGIESQRIENDLIAMVDYLEDERDRVLAETDREGPRDLTEEERELGMELLRDPHLFDRIVSDMEMLGYVGEELNKQLLYVAASSRKMADPVSVLILSQSASGKSLLVETVRRLMPEEDVVSLTSLSDQALNYLPEGGLLHKFLILGEAVHSEVVEHQIREMLSGHELSRLVTVKDEKTGRMTSRMVRSPVVVSAMMSSTAHDVNPENASRYFVINADESREQTRRIHASQKRKYSLQHHSEERSIVPKIVRQHQAAQRLLTRRLIVNPFSEHLSFPDSLMRSRRDHARFIDLIAAVCFLRQFLKEEKHYEDPDTGQQVRYIECDLTDYSVAYRILKAILPATLTTFPQSAMTLYEAVRELLKRKARSEGLKVTEVSLSQREIREKTDFNQRWIKRYMRILSEYEYLQAGGIMRRGSRNAYRLVADEPIHLVDISMVPTPQQMEGKV